MTTQPSPFTPLLLRLAQLFGGLRTAVAACGGRRMLGWDRRPDDPRIVPLIIPICAHFSRLMARFERLVARLAAGWRPSQTARAPRPAGSPRAPRPPSPLPRRFGWLVVFTHGATAYAGHLQVLLAEPGIADLLAAAPSAGRLLRPLCRMLGIRPGPPLAEAAPPPANPARPRSPDGRFRSPAPHWPPPHWPPPPSRFSTPT